MSPMSLPHPGVGLPSVGPPLPAAGCDCRSCPFYVHNPQAVEPICSGCSSSCEYCGCARAEDPTRPDYGQACATCPIRCGSRVDIAAWMADVGGTLRFDDLRPQGRLPAGLPRFVPQVDTTAVAGLDASLGWPAYAVGLRRVFSPTAHRLLPQWRDACARDVLGLCENQLAVLLGYGEDPLVEGLWTRRHADQLVEAIAGQGWDVVLAPNYSLYANQPRAEQLLNFRRNLMLATELAEAGVCAVANLYWLRLEDLERYLDWIADLAPDGPAAVAVNVQTFRTAADWQQMALPGLTLLAAGLPSDLPVVITGASRADRIGVLSELFGSRLYLVSQNALAYARHGALMTRQGRVTHHARVADLFAANVRHYANLLDQPGVTVSKTDDTAEGRGS